MLELTWEIPITPGSTVGMLAFYPLLCRTLAPFDVTTLTNLKPRSKGLRILLEKHFAPDLANGNSTTFQCTR